MKKLLVLVEDYPNNDGGVSLMYVHTRNLYYISQGMSVTVLNFSVDIGYTKDGIKVITEDEYKKSAEKYDALILHAANIRNHYRFLKKYGSEFNKYIFFYHGHEVLRCNSVYPKPYKYVKRNIFKEIVQDLYDSYKLAVWRNYLIKVRDKAYFVFVSNWMKEEFLKWTRIPESIIKGHYQITYNSIGAEFEDVVFDSECEKNYDFCTIRNNLDASKYAIDIVNHLAKNTPDKKFLVVGKGEYFLHDEKADNLEWKNQTLNHDEIIEVLQKSRFALMPTRTDAQGLMMCEMAAMGIPVITSDIPVCHEVFKDFENVYFIDNEKAECLSEFDNSMSICVKQKKYYKDCTVKNEVQIIREALGMNSGN